MERTTKTSPCVAVRAGCGAVEGGWLAARRTLNCVGNQTTCGQPLQRSQLIPALVSDSLGSPAFHVNVVVRLHLLWSNDFCAADAWSTSGHFFLRTQHKQQLLLSRTNVGIVVPPTFSVDLYPWLGGYTSPPKTEDRDRWPVHCPITPHYTVLLSFTIILSPPPPERCKFSQQVWTRVMN